MLSPLLRNDAFIRVDRGATVPGQIKRAGVRASTPIPAHAPDRESLEGEGRGEGQRARPTPPARIYGSVLVWIVMNGVITNWYGDVGAPLSPNQSQARTCTGPVGTFLANMKMPTGSVESNVAGTGTP